MPGPRPAPPPARDLDRDPVEVTWEITRASDGAARDPSGEEAVWRHPRELSTIEAMLLMNRLRAFGRPLLSLVGGDPAFREDLPELVGHASRLGLPTRLAAEPGPRTGSRLLRRLRDAGLGLVSIPLDEPGTDAAARRLVERARSAGIEREIRTRVGSGTAAALDALAGIVAAAGAVAWRLAFPTRPDPETGEWMAPAAVEALLERLVARDGPCPVEVVEAPQIARIAIRAGDPAGRRSTGAARGELFVSHVGEIRATRALPVSVGSVRTTDVVEAYRGSALFRELRDRDALGGKCGECEFRVACGGSRARAWARSGDWLEGDPFCPYRPPGWSGGSGYGRLAAYSGTNG